MTAPGSAKRESFKTAFLALDFPARDHRVSGGLRPTHTIGPLGPLCWEIFAAGAWPILPQLVRQPGAYPTGRLRFWDRRIGC
jgi:hypothetical protein